MSTKLGCKMCLGPEKTPINSWFLVSYNWKVGSGSLSLTLRDFWLISEGVMSESWWKLDSLPHGYMHPRTCQDALISRCHGEADLWPWSCHNHHMDGWVMARRKWSFFGSRWLEFILDESPSTRSWDMDRKLFLRHFCILIIYLLPVQHHLLSLLPIPGLSWTYGWNTPMLLRSLIFVHIRSTLKEVN